MAIPTLEPLERATITYTGTSITVLFRDRDRLSSQLKQMVSHQMKRPILFIFQTNNSIKHEWWYHGLNYNPLGAAVMVSDQNHYTEYHHRPDGQLGCDYGPAMVEHYYGNQYAEKWITDNGRLNRDDDGPAITEITYGLAVDTSATFFKKREMGWYRHGKPYRENSWGTQNDFRGTEKFETIPPMGFMRTLNVDERNLFWYGEQEDLHRTDGPAVLKLFGVTEIEKDGKMAGWKWKDWQGVWYLHGEVIPTGKILDWAKKNHIPMWNEPCYNRSVFRDEDGELCFLTDFVGV